MGRTESRKLMTRLDDVETVSFFTTEAKRPRTC